MRNSNRHTTQPAQVSQRPHLRQMLLHQVLGQLLEEGKSVLTPAKRMNSEQAQILPWGDNNRQVAALVGILSSNNSQATPNLRMEQIKVKVRELLRSHMANRISQEWVATNLLRRRTLPTVQARPLGAAVLAV